MCLPLTDIVKVCVMEILLRIYSGMYGGFFAVLPSTWSIISCFKQMLFIVNYRKTFSMHVLCIHKASTYHLIHKAFIYNKVTYSFCTQNNPHNY